MIRVSLRLLGLCLFLLTACGQPTSVSDCFHRIIVKDYKLNSVLCTDNVEKRIFRNSWFSIELPENTFSNGQDEDQVAFQTVLDIDHAQPSDFTTSVSFFSNSSSCIQNMRDVKLISMEQQNGESILWGKVNSQSISFIENSFNPDIFYPLVCMPINKTTDIAYAFCSEKNGKQAIICMTQVTDNPEMAEEIFSTFRWMN